jgi:hypothetical protein
VPCRNDTPNAQEMLDPAERAHSDACVRRASSGTARGGFDGSGPRTRGGGRTGRYRRGPRGPARPLNAIRAGVPRGPRGLDPNGGPTGLGLAPTAGVAAATAGGGAPGAAGAAAAAAYARGAMAARGGAAEHGLGDEEGVAPGGERAGTPEDAALARKFLNTTSPALPKARPGRCRPARAPAADKPPCAGLCPREPAWRPPQGVHSIQGYAAQAEDAEVPETPVARPLSTFTPCRAHLWC